MKRPVIFWILGLVAVAVFLYAFVIRDSGASSGTISKNNDTVLDPDNKAKSESVSASLTLDTVLFNQKLAHITNGDSSGKWPVKSAYPLAGAILPFKRIIAFYGNLYSKQMGILGELPRKQMLEKLQGEVKKWQAADTAIE